MTTVRTYLSLFATGLLSVSCSGGKSAPATASNTSGVALPQEISALPTKSASGSPKLSAALSVSQALGVSQAISADSDYANARTFKFVDEQALSQFSILNTIFKAVGQTHYADAENLGAGPYGAMVTWLEDHGDTQTKGVKSWVVESSMVGSVNDVKVWMRDMMDGGGPGGLAPPVLKAHLEIIQAPAQNADGSYSDYGVWTLNVPFDPTGTFFFMAKADHDGDLSRVMIHQKEPDKDGGGPGAPRETIGILERSADHGFGKVMFPDWSSCHDPNCVPPDVTVAYVYDANHVALKKGSDPVIYKDRTSMVDLVNRYGLYDSDTGADTSKSHQFGFPIRYSSDGGTTWQFGYYGAWQGRHNIWSNNQQALPEGTTVYRGDRPPGAAAESYTVSKAFTGTLVKRTLVDANIQDIKDLVVETWVNQNFNFQFDTSWHSCTMQPMQPPVCGTAEFTDWPSFAYNPSDTRRNVGMGYMAPFQCQTPPCTPPPPVNLVYCADTVSCPLASSVPGFYVANQNNGPPTPTAQAWSGPVAGGNLWVNVGGSVYISFDGTGWVQKKLIAFDQTTYTPTFAGADQDVPYVLEIDREYYINNPGANYIVKMTAPGTYDVKIELQSVANPVNASTFVPANTTFTQQWGGQNPSTFRFVTDPNDPNFLKLVYVTVGAQDNTPGAAVDAVVQSGQWGLVASGGAGQFNWDYPQSGQNWGTVQYLKNLDGTYKILDNPIRLQPIVLQNHHGDSKTLSLQFDGSWVNGLPDVFHDLQQNGFQLTQAIADKVVVIPSGTEVVDADGSGKHYLFKQLQVNEFLSIISAVPGLDPSSVTLDLTSVPGLTNPGMGAIPDVPVKYSEGVLVP